jgi:hypothetical protein
MKDKIAKGMMLWARKPNGNVQTNNRWSWFS